MIENTLSKAVTNKSFIGQGPYELGREVQVEQIQRERWKAFQHKERCKGGNEHISVGSLIYPKSYHSAWHISGSQYLWIVKWLIRYADNIDTGIALHLKDF